MQTNGQRARVLEVGVGEIAFVDGAVAFDGQRNVEVADLVAVALRKARHLIDGAVVARLHFVGILDHLVDEIAEVQNEIELLRGGRAFVFVNHPAVGVELSFIHILTAHEGEVHRAGIVWRRRGDGAADAAPVAVGVGKPIPVGVRGFESADQNARGPVGHARDRRLSVRNDSFECLILGDLNRQEMTFALGEGPPRPKDDAVRVGIARRDSLRK